MWARGVDLGWGGIFYQENPLLSFPFDFLVWSNYIKKITVMMIVINATRALRYFIVAGSAKNFFVRLSALILLEFKNQTVKDQLINNQDDPVFPSAIYCVCFSLDIQFLFK